MADWYLAIGGQQKGPFSEAQVAADLRAGRIDAQTPAFTEGMTDWAAISTLPAFANAKPAPAAAAPRGAAPAPAAAAAAPARAASPASAPSAGDTPSHTLAQFLHATGEKDNPGDVFELESSHMLEVHVNGRIWSKLGAMVAYRGQLKFIREGAFEGGLGKFVTKHFCVLTAVR